MSTRTIRHRLSKDLKLLSRKPLKKPFLTPKWPRKGFNSATSTKVGPRKTGRKSCFRMNQLFYALPATVPMSDDQLAYRQSYIQATDKHPPSVMVRECFSSQGRDGLYFLPKDQTINVTRYIDVLDNHLLAFMNIHGCMIFQQDSAPYHKSKAVTK